MADKKPKLNDPTQDTKEDTSAIASVMFNMIDVNNISKTSSEIIFCSKTERFLDESAPYSGIGELEFGFYRSKLSTIYPGVYDEFPIEIIHQPFR